MEGSTDAAGERGPQARDIPDQMTHQSLPEEAQQQQQPHEQKSVQAAPERGSTGSKGNQARQEQAQAQPQAQPQQRQPVHGSEVSRNGQQQQTPGPEKPVREQQQPQQQPNEQRQKQQELEEAGKQQREPLKETQPEAEGQSQQPQREQQQQQQSAQLQRQQAEEQQRPEEQQPQQRQRPDSQGQQQQKAVSEQEPKQQQQQQQQSEDHQRPEEQRSEQQQWSDPQEQPGEHQQKAASKQEPKEQQREQEQGQTQEAQQKVPTEQLQQGQQQQPERCETEKESDNLQRLQNESKMQDQQEQVQQQQQQTSQQDQQIAPGAREEQQQPQHTQEQEHEATETVPTERQVQKQQEGQQQQQSEEPQDTQEQQQQEPQPIVHSEGDPEEVSKPPAASAAEEQQQKELLGGDEQPQMEQQQGEEQQQQEQPPQEDQQADQEGGPPAVQQEVQLQPEEERQGEQRQDVGGNSVEPQQTDQQLQEEEQQLQQHEQQLEEEVQQLEKEVEEGEKQLRGQQDGPEEEQHPQQEVQDEQLQQDLQKLQQDDQRLHEGKQPMEEKLPEESNDKQQDQLLLPQQQAAERSAAVVDQELQQGQSGGVSSVQHDADSKEQQRYQQNLLQRLASRLGPSPLNVSWSIGAVADLVALEQEGLLYLAPRDSSNRNAGAARLAVVPEHSLARVDWARGGNESAVATAAREHWPAKVDLEAGGNEGAATAAASSDLGQFRGLVRFLATADEELMMQQKRQEQRQVQPTQQQQEKKQEEHPAEKSSVDAAGTRTYIQTLLLTLLRLQRQQHCLREQQKQHEQHEQQRNNSGIRTLWLVVELPIAAVNSAERHQRRCALRCLRRQQLEAVERQERRLGLSNVETQPVVLQQQTQLEELVNQQQQVQEEEQNNIADMRQSPIRVTVSAVAGIGDVAPVPELHASKSSPPSPTEPYGKKFSFWGSFRRKASSKGSLRGSALASGVGGIAAGAGVGADGAQRALQGAKRLLSKASKALSLPVSSLSQSTTSQRGTTQKEHLVGEGSLQQNDLQGAAVGSEAVAPNEAGGEAGVPKSAAAESTPTGNAAAEGEEMGAAAGRAEEEQHHDHKLVSDSEGVAASLVPAQLPKKVSGNLPLLRNLAALLQLSEQSSLLGLEAAGDIRTEEMWEAVCVTARQHLAQILALVPHKSAPSPEAVGVTIAATTEPKASGDQPRSPWFREGASASLDKEMQHENSRAAKMQLQVRKRLLLLRQSPDEVGAPLLPPRVDQPFGDEANESEGFCEIDEQSSPSRGSSAGAALTGSTSAAAALVHAEEVEAMLLAAFALLEVLIRSQQTLQYLCLGAPVLELLAQAPDLLLTDWGSSQVAKVQRRILGLLADSSCICPLQEGIPQQPREQEQQQEQQQEQHLLHLHCLEVLVLNRPLIGSAFSRMLTASVGNNLSGFSTCSSCRSRSSESSHGSLVESHGESADAEPWPWQEVDKGEHWRNQGTVSAEEGIHQTPQETEALQWEWHYKLAKGNIFEIFDDTPVHSLENRPTLDNTLSLMQQRQQQTEQLGLTSADRNAATAGIRGGALRCFAAAVAARPTTLAAFVCQPDELKQFVDIIGRLAVPMNNQEQQHQHQQQPVQSRALRSLYVCNAIEGHVYGLHTHTGAAVDTASEEAKTHDRKREVKEAAPGVEERGEEATALPGAEKAEARYLSLASRSCRDQLFQTEVKVLPYVRRMHLKRCSMLLPLLVCPSVQQLLLQQTTANIKSLLVFLECCSGTIRQLYIHRIKGQAAVPVRSHSGSLHDALPPVVPSQVGDFPEVPAGVAAAEAPGTEAATAANGVDGADPADVGAATACAREKEPFGFRERSGSRPLLSLPQLHQYGGTVRLFCQRARGLFLPSLRKLYLTDAHSGLQKCLKGQQQHRRGDATEKESLAGTDLKMQSPRTGGIRGRSYRGVDGGLLQRFLKSHVPQLEVLSVDGPVPLPFHAGATAPVVCHLQHLAIGQLRRYEGFEKVAGGVTEKHRGSHEQSVGGTGMCPRDSHSEEGSENRSASDTEEEPSTAGPPISTSLSFPFTVSDIGSREMLPDLLCLAVAGRVTVEALMRLTTGGEGSPVARGSALAGAGGSPLLFLFLGAIVSSVEEKDSENSHAGSREVAQSPSPKVASPAAGTSEVCGVSSRTVEQLLQRCPSLRVFGLQQLPPGVHLQVLETRLKRSGFVRVDKQLAASMILYEPSPYAGTSKICQPAFPKTPRSEQFVEDEGTGDVHNHTGDTQIAPSLRSKHPQGQPEEKQQRNCELNAAEGSLGVVEGPLGTPATEAGASGANGLQGDAADNEQLPKEALQDETTGAATAGDMTPAAARAVATASGEQPIRDVTNSVPAAAHVHAFPPNSNKVAAATPRIVHSSCGVSEEAAEKACLPELRALEAAAACLLSPEIVELKSPHFETIREKLQQDAVDSATSSLPCQGAPAELHRKPSCSSAAGRPQTARNQQQQRQQKEIKKAVDKAVARMLRHWKHVFVRFSPEGLRAIGNQ